MAISFPGVVFSILMPLACILPSTSYSLQYDFPTVFNFGDSNSDTGNFVAGLGDNLMFPNGQLYFNSPSGRFCDGRLVVDFLMYEMDLPFLSAYLDSIGLPNFYRGCNFAVAASTILPATPASLSPFSLGIQINQFMRFKARVLQFLAQGQTRVSKFVPAESFFAEGLYMFDIGQNDLAGALYSRSSDQVSALIPSILEELENGIQRLHNQGARKFWIHNTGPLGCLPQSIDKVDDDQSKLDELGCVADHNQVAKLFNLQLHALCKKLHFQFANSDITYIDIYSIKLNLIANYSRYGFQQPVMACCGHGGPPLNYDSRISCGQTKVLNGTLETARSCNESTLYVNWDGIHYTEAANQFVSSQILTGIYADPPF